ncbi:MAG TPA: LytTR family DNA-binding domain-containing protein [Acidimicrobiales bacterium]|nr:LytTR family DNA-binding domain-containing protein [Acidimicrobiales bacterium]
MTLLSALAVDDELPALDELDYLLRASGLVGEVVAVRNATEALRQLRDRSFDVVVLDIAMPGLGGMELASVLAQFSEPPALVFVTAHEEHALEAFDVGAVGYLLKPLDQQRLQHVLKRINTLGPGRDTTSGGGESLDVVPVDASGRTVLVNRSEVAWVESAGDYVRLHTFDGRSLLVRLSLGRLEEAWVPEGFARIHRQYLVCLRAVREMRTDGAQMFVQVPPGTELPVSRRHVRELRERLIRHARGVR